MHFAFDLAHGDAIVRELAGRIRRTWAVIDGLRDFRNWERVDELRQGACVERGPKLGCGLLMRTCSLGQSQSCSQDSAALKKCSPGQGHFWVSPSSEARGQGLGASCQCSVASSPRTPFVIAQLVFLVG